ncbi:hypothetical protein PIB30_002445 [Stylosanthes scabra]|uniref:Uncharacterized protein n=1 Tax=Stylosanthes scabra TaxID=79078 RepID=A0ABU6W3B4_9FABA|nr:hypothetical protein [Stylosanthes scabra]
MQGLRLPLGAFEGWERGVTTHLHNRVKVQGGLSTSHAHEMGTSMHAEVPAIPQTQQTVATPTIASSSQAFLDGLSSPRFQHVHSDLKEPVSTPSHSFMAALALVALLSAHMSGRAWEMPFMEPTAIPTPPASPASTEHRDELPARGRGHRIPRHRGCSIGGHI